MHVFFVVDEGMDHGSDHEFSDSGEDDGMQLDEIHEVIGEEIQVDSDTEGSDEDGDGEDYDGMFQIQLFFLLCAIEMRT